MNPLVFLFAGMTAAWLLVFVYLAHVARRTARLERQLDDALRMLDDRRTGSTAETVGDDG